MDNQVSEPHDNDVLCGRGGYINSHPGNERFRKLVEKRKRVYLAARFKREKRLVADSIVSEIRALDKPGRFLAKDSKTGKWFDIGDEKARDKTSQALRENAPSIRAEIKVGIDQRRAEEAKKAGGDETIAKKSTENNSKKATTKKSKTKGKKTKEKALPDSSSSGAKINHGYAPQLPPPPPQYFNQHWNYYPQHPGYAYPPPNHPPNHPPPYVHNDRQGHYATGRSDMGPVPVNQSSSMMYGTTTNSDRHSARGNLKDRHRHSPVHNENMRPAVTQSSMQPITSMHSAPTESLSNLRLSNHVDMSHHQHSNYHKSKSYSSPEYQRKIEVKRTFSDDAWEPANIQGSRGFRSPDIRKNPSYSKSKLRSKESWEFSAAMHDSSMEEEVGQEVELVESMPFYYDDGVPTRERAPPRDRMFTRNRGTPTRDRRVPTRDRGTPTRGKIDDETRMPPPMRSPNPKRLEIDWTSTFGCQSSWLPDSFASPSFFSQTSTNNGISPSTSMDISAIESHGTGGFSAVGIESVGTGGLSAISGISAIGTSGTDGMSCAGSVGGGSLCHVFSQDQSLNGSVIPMTKVHSLASSALSVASMHSIVRQESFKSWNATSPDRCRSPSFSDRSFRSKLTGLECQISPVATSTGIRRYSQSSISQSSR